MIQLGQRIKQIRESLGLSQQALAEKLGISRPSISQIENGERKVSAEELKKLSETFNVSTDALLDCPQGAANYDQGEGGSLSNRSRHPG